MMQTMYSEKEYISKKGNKYVESSIFGKCKVISQTDVCYELEGNERFYPCDNIPESDYKFYVDEEVLLYYACKK